MGVWCEGSQCILEETRCEGAQALEGETELQREDQLREVLVREFSRINTNGREKMRGTMAELLHKDEVYAIVGAATEVYNNLGSGFLEGVYQESMDGVPFKEHSFDGETANCHPLQRSTPE